MPRATSSSSRSGPRHATRAPLPAKWGWGPIASGRASRDDGHIPARRMSGRSRPQRSITMHVQALPARGPTSAEPRSTIVVGYDGSNESRAALTLAAARAGEDGTVVAVFATEPASNWLDTSYYDRAVKSRHERTERIIAELSNIELGNVTIEAELADGPAAQALTEVAQLHDAREIVIGSRGLRGIRAALGSVSRRLLQIADRPVVVVPPVAVRAAGGQRASGRSIVRE